MKVLIIRFSSIGDIVLTTPVIRTIKLQVENVKVHFAVKKEYAAILQANPYLDKIHTLDADLNGLIKKLKKEKFDFIVDLHNNLRTRVIKSRLRVKSSGFYKLNIQKWLRVNLRIDLLPNHHLVDRYMAAAKPVGIKPDTLGLEYFIPEKDEVEIDWLPEDFRKEFVAVVIGGRHYTKKLPFDRLVELCDRINKPIVLLGGNEDEETGKRIEVFFEKRNDQPEVEKTLVRKLGKKSIIFNACGKFNINQSASILRQSMLVFTHDTGLMHIAAAFKKQIYSIWGNTIPEFGMYPYRTPFVIFEKKGLKCRPCSKIGFDHCPKGHFRCMKDLKFDFYIPD